MITSVDSSHAGRVCHFVAWCGLLAAAFEQVGSRESVVLEYVGVLLHVDPLDLHLIRTLVVVNNAFVISSWAFQIWTKRLCLSSQRTLFSGWRSCSASWHPSSRDWDWGTFRSCFTSSGFLRIVFWVSCFLYLSSLTLLSFSLVLHLNDFSSFVVTSWVFLAPMRLRFRLEFDLLM